MKKILTLILICALPLLAAAQNAAPAKELTPEAKAAEEKSKTLYSMGFLMGENLKKNLVVEDEEEFKAISQGMRDSVMNRSPQVDYNLYRNAIMKRYQDDAKKLNEKRADEQEKFMAAFRKEKNVKALPGDILVKTVLRGKGAFPKEDDSVKVHYTGTLLDGTVFDSSVERGQAAEFPLNGVISCWTKGLQEMRSGGKARLVCPSATAYGNRQIGAIPPNSMLIFDVELLEVKGK